MVRLGAGVQEAARGRQEVRGWLSAGLVLRAARAARPSRACAAAAELIFFYLGNGRAALATGGATVAPSCTRVGAQLICLLWHCTRAQCRQPSHRQQISRRAAGHARRCRHMRAAPTPSSADVGGQRGSRAQHRSILCAAYRSQLPLVACLRASAKSCSAAQSIPVPGRRGYLGTVLLPVLYR